MLEVGKQAGQFFELRVDHQGRKSYALKSLEQYSKEHSNREQPSKKYFAATTLPEIISTYPSIRKDAKQADLDKGTCSFIVMSAGLT